MMPREPKHWCYRCGAERFPRFLVVEYNGRDGGQLLISRGDQRNLRAITVANIQLGLTPGFQPNREEEAR